MIKNQSSFVIVSFVLSNIDFNAIIKSLNLLGIDHDIKRLTEKEADEIQFSQAVFLKKMLIKYHPRPVVWMDPVTIVKRYPEQFEVQSTDVAVYVDEAKVTINPCIIYLKNTVKSHQMIDLWISRGLKSISRERSNLVYAISAWQRQHRGRLGRIPESYVDGNVCGVEIA